MDWNSYQTELQTTLGRMSGIDEKIEGLVDRIKNLYDCGGILLVAGNGGSAADAQHFVAELVGTYSDRERRGLPAIALTSNTSNLTSIANDFDYESVFSRQVEAFRNLPCLVLGITTSGNSPNIYKAFQESSRYAQHEQFALLGKTGGICKDFDNILVPSNHTGVIQTVHNMVYHTVCDQLDQLYKGQ